MSGMHFHSQTPTALQGINSATFTEPPFKDRFFTVPELYDWHSVHSRDHPFFVYFDESSGTKVTVSWAEAVKVVRSIAQLVSTSVRERSGDHTKPLVALHSSSDTLSYLLAFVGIMYAGFPVFLISNRIAPAALKHLLTKSGATHIFTGEHDKALRENLEETEVDLGVRLSVTGIPSALDILSNEFSFQGNFAEPCDAESVCIVLHSSGSTALPELNTWTHRMTLTPILQPWYGERDLCGLVMSTPSIPMAGASGVMQALLSASSGMVMSGFKPSSPPVMPNPQNVWDSLISTGSHFSFILQPFLAMWSEDPSKVMGLAELEGVAFGGAPLPRAVGDKLASKGVEIFTFFGSSEAGLINRVFPRKMGKDWEWFSFYSLLNPVFRPEPDEKTVELILTSCSTHKPTKFNTEVNGVPGYATGDLLEPHPNDPKLWRYVCRISDQETMGVGPKVNVAAFARLLMQDPLIAGAVLFSHTIGYSIVCGVIIEPASAQEVKDLEAMNMYKDRIWPTLERYNNLAPEGGRMTKERVIVAARDKPFTYGEKGMPRRKEVIAMYRDEIKCLV